MGEFGVVRDVFDHYQVTFQTDWHMCYEDASDECDRLNWMLKRVEMKSNDEEHAKAGEVMVAKLIQSLDNERFEVRRLRKALDYVGVYTAQICNDVALVEYIDKALTPELVANEDED